MIVVFFGSRTWTDVEAIEQVVDELLLEGDGSLVGVHGGAPRGLDHLVDLVLRRRGFSPIAVPADWRTHDHEGRTEVPCRHRPVTNRRGEDFCPAAGNRRNQAIVDEYVWPHVDGASGQGPVHAVGFRCTYTPSPGTDDMRERLRPYIPEGLQARFLTAGGPAPDERRLFRERRPLAASGRAPWPEAS